MSKETFRLLTLSELINRIKKAKCTGEAIVIPYSLGNQKGIMLLENGNIEFIKLMEL